MITHYLINAMESPSKEQVTRLLETAARLLGNSRELARRHVGEANLLLDNTRGTRRQRGFH